MRTHLSPHLSPAHSRQGLRRSVELSCELVSLERFAILGRRTLDVSRGGALIVASEDAEPGEQVLLHLTAPDQTRVCAEAVVSRVVHGQRRGDSGRALGLRFLRTPTLRLDRLMRQLRGTPPRVPGRHLRVDYAAIVRSIGR
jgi:hypothetical protein